jgi:MFS family permease
MFYAWMITVYSLGEVILAPISGYATRWIPYWYILLAGIVLHIVGYVFYSVAQFLWVMIIARLLTGAYAGIIETIGYAYIGERAVEYEGASARQQRLLLGKKKIESTRIKEKAYALLTLSITVSYLAGPGKCLIMEIHYQPPKLIEINQLMFLVAVWSLTAKFFWLYDAIFP